MFVGGANVEACASLGIGVDLFVQYGFDLSFLF
jgi:hypothetical protein